MRQPHEKEYLVKIHSLVARIDVYYYDPETRTQHLKQMRGMTKA